MDDSGNPPPEGLHTASGLGQATIPQKRISYKKMITEAIESLKERRGSSRQSIVKYITSKYNLGRGSVTRINSMITKMSKNKQLLRTRGTLEDGAFKLGVKHSTPFASAGRSRRGKGRRYGRKKRGRKGRRGRGGRRRKKKGKRGRKRKGRKAKRGRKRKGRRGKKRKSSRSVASFLPGI